MTKAAFDKIAAGLEDAIAYTKGAKTKLIPFEAEHHFKTDEDVDFLVSDALASGDEAYIARAREIAARKRKGCE